MFSMFPLAQVPDSTHVLLDDDLLELTGRRLRQLVLGLRFPAQEDVEHQRNALEAQQIISAIGFSPRSFLYRWCVRAYRLAGISILSCGGSCVPSTIGRSWSVVCVVSAARY